MNTATMTRLLAVSFALLASSAAWTSPARAAAPVLDPIANMTVEAGGCAPSSADQAISATDPDGDAITFTSSGPAFMTVTSNPQVGNTRTGNIHLSAPPPGTTGNFLSSVTATAGGESDTKSFTISVIVVNQPPVLDQPANMTVNEGATADQTITGADPCGAPLTFTKVSGPAFLTVTTTSATTGNMNLAPGFLDAGTYTATIQASNGSGGTDTKSFTITVNNVNGAPTLVGPASVTMNEGAISDQLITGSDPDGDCLTFSKVSGPTFMAITTTSCSTGNIHLAPGFSDAGTYPATVRATDTGGLFGDWSFTITVNNLNRQPAIAAPATASGTEGSPIAPITATATDADATDNLTITQTGKPASLTFTAQAPGPSPRTARITGTPGFTDAGTYTIVWTVNDGTGTPNATMSTTTVLTIIGEHPRPAITAPATASGQVGSAIATITATAVSSDPAVNLTITQTGKPASLTFTAQAPGPSPRTATITGTPTFTDAGTYSIVWTVNDGTGTPGGTASTTTVLTICSGGPAPAITAPATASGSEGSPIATITATATDPDAANTLTITQTGKPASLTFTTNSPGVSPRTATLTGTPGFNDAGTYSIVWTVNDGTGACSSTASTTTVLTIANSNAAPTITAPATWFGGEGAPIDCAGATLAATATDADAADVLTITQTGKPASLTFTTNSPGVSPRTATISGTTSFTDAGIYSIVWTVNDGTGAANATASTTTVLTISGVNQRPAITAPATATGMEGSAITPITATATDADACNTLTITQAGKPASLVFTAQAPGVSPRTATITGTPGFADHGTYNVVWTVNDGTGVINGTASTTTVLTILGTANQQPAFFSTPATASGVEGSPIAAITAIAVDQDALDNLTITQAGKPASLVFTAQAPGVSPRTATITGTPAFGSAGTYSIVWMVNDGTGSANATASATTVLTVSQGVNRCPIANPDGPYFGVLGAPISFDGSASPDPDGDPLNYAWDFDASDGIAVDATGPTPVHTYLAAGIFMVTLTVTDNGNGDPDQVCSDTATTTATIAPSCPATVFNGYDVVRLASGRPSWFAFVQPEGGCYANTDVVLPSLVLKYAGNQISADAKKTLAGGDRSGDGIEEIRVSFSKPNLRTLFAGLPDGHNLVDVTIEANLTTGGIFQGTTQVDVFVSGSSSAASVSPNPMNPAATLRFTTTRPGLAKVEMFDVGGRLVRTILDEPSLAAGMHEVRIEGRGQRGESLASGIYFIRGISAEGEFTKTIAILK